MKYRSLRRYYREISVPGNINWSIYFGKFDRMIKFVVTQPTNSIWSNFCILLLLFLVINSKKIFNLNKVRGWRIWVFRIYVRHLNLPRSLRWSKTGWGNLHAPANQFYDVGEFPIRTGPCGNYSINALCVREGLRTYISWIMDEVISSNSIEWKKIVLTHPTKSV